MFLKLINYKSQYYSLYKNVPDFHLHILNKTCFHTNVILHKVEDRKMMMASLPAKDEGTKGEKSIAIDSLINRYI